MRSSSAFLQAARQLEAFVSGPQAKSGLSQLEEAMGVAQHHDAVSGTEKQVLLSLILLRTCLRE